MTNKTEKTYYGVSSKLFSAAVATITDPAELGHMLAWARKRAGDLAAKHPSRVKRWERVATQIQQRLTGAQPGAVSAFAPTFTQAPLPKAKRGGKRKAASKGIDVTALSDADADALFRQLASRIAARA